MKLKFLLIKFCSNNLIMNSSIISKLGMKSDLKFFSGIFNMTLFICEIIWNKSLLNGSKHFIFVCILILII